jgi:hypothetical protein
MFMLCYNWQLTKTLFLFIHIDKLGNKNLQFAQSVLRKFRVDAITHKIPVGPTHVWIGVPSTGAFDVK